MPKLWADSLDEHRTLVRRRLVDAFVAVARERPMDDVTIAAVAEHAGMARSAVYNHVDHLHDLALWHSEEVIGAWVASLDDGATATAFERLERLARHALAMYATDPIAGLDLSGHLDAERQARLFAQLAPAIGHLHSTVADGVASGELVDEDPAELAVFVWATVSGHRSEVAEGRRDPDEVADLVVRLLRRAVVAA